MKTDTMIRSMILGSALLWAVGVQAQEEKLFSFKDTPGQYLDVLRGGQIAGRYMYAYDTSSEKKRVETYKPYLHVFDAQGQAPITKGPGGGFTHHRGILIGWLKLSCNGQTYDLWEMKRGDEQVHRKFSGQEADGTHATFTSSVDWIDKEGKVLLTEERTQSFRRAPAPAYQMIEFTSRVKAVAGDMVLDGDAEHGGIQFRPANEVEKTKTLYVFPGQNANPRKDTNLAWIAVTFSLGAKRYSVVQMNHPSNPHDVKISAYRYYGRIGYFPRTALKAGEQATFKYRFLVAEGEMLPAETIQRCCNEFTGRNDPVPQLTVVPAEPPPVPKPKVSQDARKGAKTS